MSLIPSYSLCPITGNTPITGGATIPVSSTDVAGIPDLALVIPDFEGFATIRIFSNSSQTEIACFKSVMRNGASFSHPAAIGSVLGVFTFIALLASFATAIYGVSVPHIRTHYAHSLSILVVFEVFQSIFFSGALSLNWPSVCAAFWSNFAWSAGQIYSPSIINAVNSFVGIAGNSSQVGGAGSTLLNTNGGLQQQIYGRSLEKLLDRSSTPLFSQGRDIASEIYSRAVEENNATESTEKMYEWAGRVVSPGLPLPGNWSGFAGGLVDVEIPVASSFLIGFLWFLILVAILVGATILFKYGLELLSKMKWIKSDRLVFFRTHWIGFLGLIVLRTMLIGFFMMMTLTLFQFANGGKAGPLAVAVIVFLVFFGGAFGVSYYACFYRSRYGTYSSQSDRVYFQRTKVLKFIPFYKTTRESSITGDEEKPQSSGSIPLPRVQFVASDAEKSSVHGDADYIKRFGWLSARYRRTRWWFFAFWVIYQFVRACFIGGARASPAAQVIGLFIWETIAFIVIICINPFEGARNTALAVYMLGFSKVATAGLSIAFLPHFNVARIPTTIIGIIIIIIQGVLVIGLLILIVLSAVSSYISLTRNREEIRPQSLANIRKKYFSTIEKKATDLPPTPPALPEEPKEPYFALKTVRRAPKIEDEEADDIDDFPDMQNIPQPGPQAQHSLAGRNSRSNSMASHYSTVPYGARVHRASWSSRDFQSWQDNEGRVDSLSGPPSRGNSGMYGVPVTNSPSSAGPMVKSRMSQASLKLALATKEHPAETPIPNGSSAN